MHKSTVSRLALVASAAAALAAACTNGDPGSRIAAPGLRTPSYDFGVASAGTIEVCVPAGTKAGTYSFAPTGAAGNVGTDAIAPNPSVTVNGTEGSPTCVNAFTRPASPANLSSAQLTLTASTANAGTFSFTCTDDVAQKFGYPLCGPGAGGITSGSGNSATGQASSAHGSVITFIFTPAAPPPPDVIPMFVIGDVEAHGAGASVNFWGAQWWKNNDMSGAVSNGVASFKGYASNVEGRCGGVWSSRPGNSSNPPATIGSQIAIIVTSKVLKSGPNISGDIVQIVLVNTNPGYEGNPGHAGTGVVASVACPIQGANR